MTWLYWLRYLFLALLILVVCGFVYLAATNDA